MSTLRTVVYYITRDSNCAGELSGSVKLWYRKPVRQPLTFDHGYVWLPSIGPDKDFGMYGSYDIEKIRKWYGTVPDTDLECIRVETQTAEPNKT